MFDLLLMSPLMKVSLFADILSLHCLPVLHTCPNFGDFTASICCMFFANIFRELRKLNILEKIEKINSEI